MATDASTLAETPPDVAQPARVQSPDPYRFSVAQYDAMARLGILTKDDKIELIEGLLVRKLTKNPAHSTATWLLDRALGRVLPDGWFAVTESPVVLATSEPEPDVMVLRGRIEDYFDKKPVPADLALLVEIADTSYADDKARAALYGASGIVTYWIVHIPARRIEVYTEPTGPGPESGYRARRDYGPHEQVPVLLEGRVAFTFAVADLLPPTGY